MTPKKFYQVRFVCYQYNGGGSIRNGDQLITEEFDKLEDAEKFGEKVISFVKRSAEAPEGSREFASKYVWDGFVSKYLGIYRITEEFLRNY
jgi:hypothetical protein